MTSFPDQKGGEQQQDAPPSSASPSSSLPPLNSKPQTLAAARNGDRPNNKDLPLNAAWTLWFDNPKLAPQGADWKENLKPCGSFDSVGSFWRIYNNIKPATQISVQSNYSLFRLGVEPSWEDPANINGGKFVLTVTKKDSRQGKCDEWWLYTVLAVIGETMDVSGTEVNGAVVSIRKNQDRIALWLKGTDRQVLVQIAERWKKALNLGDRQTVHWQTHKDAAASGRSFRNEVHFQV